MSSIDMPSDVLLTEDGAFVRNIAWIPPCNESWKLNFFAHFELPQTGSSTNLFSCACILRDQNGFFQAACAKPLRNCDDFIDAELKALKKGLKLAIKEGVDFIEIEGNADMLYHLLAGDFTLFPSTSIAVARECFGLMSSFREIDVLQAQFYADIAVRRLAAKAFYLKKSRYWRVEIIPEIAEILTHDVLGRWIPVVVA